MIPEEWSVKPLSEVTSRISDGIHSTPVYSNDSEIYFVNGNNLKSGSVIVNKSTRRVDESEAKKHERELSDRTLLMSINGTIGNLAYYRGEKVVLGKSACYINVDVDTNINFLYYVLSDSRTQNFFFSELTGTTIRNLSLKTIKSTKIPLPQRKEQDKIAQILSTWDKAITTTEQLLANSQQQKKALMQQLLTGKKRLLDEDGVRFNGEWIEQTLGQLAKVLNGLTYSPSDVVNDTGTLVLRSSNIQGGRLTFDDNVYVKEASINQTLTQEDDILICVRNGSKALIGKSAIIKGQAINCYHGAFMTLVRAHEPFYLYQVIQSELFFREVWKNLGATINSINSKDLKNFTFRIPSLPSERNKISNVLINADNKIQRLQKKLDYLKEEKKALMQQLLTGKRRVKVDKEVA